MRHGVDVCMDMYRTMCDVRLMIFPALFCARMHLADGITTCGQAHISP